MRGLLHIGENNFSGGRAGDQPSVGLSACLEKLGFHLGRLKTGTPPRINKRSIDLSLTEEQPGEEGIRFSFDDEQRRASSTNFLLYHIHNEETKKIILDNLHRSPMYSGKIESVGPRYCPSIEDKVVRFSDKERHQLFLEPEGLNTEEIYVNGISSSLPLDVQYAFIKSIPALKNAEIMRPAYAIEYDYVSSGKFTSSLESKSIEGLFLAGQINGTTGYEEAAAQGLMAGINAASRVAKRDPLVLQRSESYIGVMIDDLITKGLDEPYRMFTSRAEHRLLLRQDNADLRLRKYGYEYGLIDQKRWSKLQEKEKRIEQEISRFEKTYKQVNGKGHSLAQLMRRPDMTYKTLLELYPESVENFAEEICLQIELNLKYAGYINRQKIEIGRIAQVENQKIPANFDFNLVIGLRNEAKQKLNQHHPSTLGQASRISGVSPADISVLIVELTKRNRKAIA